jgi:hypothetical protein
MSSEGKKPVQLLQGTLDLTVLCSLAGMGSQPAEEPQ